MSFQEVTFGWAEETGVTRLQRFPRVRTNIHKNAVSAVEDMALTVAEGAFPKSENRVTFLLGVVDGYGVIQLHVAASASYAVSFAARDNGTRNVEAITLSARQWGLLPSGGRIQDRQNRLAVEKK